MKSQTVQIEQAIEGLDHRAKLRLIEVLARALRQDQTVPTSNQRRTQLDGLLRDLDALLSEIANGGFSNRDHHTLLYGRWL